MTKTQSLTLAVAQPITAAHDVAANVAAHADVIVEANADLVIFPELSLTGYHFDAEPIAPDDQRLQPLIETCRRTKATALVGAPVRVAHETGDVNSISVLRVDGRAISVAYRKMYLGSDEQAHFQAGTAPAVIEIDGWRIGLAVCKDTGVAEHAAATAALGIDVYAAGVLEHSTDADIAPARARRITTDHRVWVAMAGFASPTGEGYDSPAGGSTIWFPDGTVAATAGVAPGRLARFTLYG